MKKLLTLFTALLFLGGLMSVQAADTYIVAGEPTDVFGSNWDKDASNNKMTLDGSVYKYEKNITADATAIFKVVKNGNWSTAYPSSNYSIAVKNGGKLVILFNPTGTTVTAYATGGYIGIHGSMNGWNTVQNTASSNKETASYTYTNLTAGDYEFGMRLYATDNWTSNGANFTRTNSSRTITSGSGNCTFNADIDGDYTFTWTYATNTLEITYPDLPEQSVDFDGLAAQVQKGTAVNFAATSSGIANPGYRYYVKEKNGAYGSAVTSYTFNTIGEYVVKVEALANNTGEPLATKEANVSVYETYTFTSGTRLYVDFSAVSGDVKGVNYPFQNTNVGLDYDVNGAGTFKTIQFTSAVTWSTLNDFIKTEKNGWKGLKFTAPGEGQNKVIVAADGASYTWGTYTPETVQVKFFAPKNVQHPWSDVYVYSWDTYGDVSAAWPGDAVTTKNGEWYVYAAQKGVNLIFHDNAGLQTSDITNVQANVCYVPTEIGTKVAVTEQCTVDYYISGTKELTGLTEDWVVADANLKLDANNQIVFQNLAAGSYEFKITNGTWAWSIGGNDHLMGDECASIATTQGLGNVGFTIDHTQDVTITYYPATQKICLGAETTKSTASVTVNDTTVYVSKAITINATKVSDATAIQYEILTGSDKINITDGQITGVAEGTATVRASVAETDNYLSAYKDFTVTVAPLKYYLKNNWNGCDWTWKEMTAAEGGKFRLENVVYGGNGINYNYMQDDAEAIWKESAKIKYMDGTNAKVVAAYDTIDLVLDPTQDTIWAEMVNKDTVVVYTVAGNTMALFDLGWTATHPYKYTDMKKQEDGTYAWNYGGESVVLPAGDLEFKVIKSRDYANGSWPENPFVYPIQRGGEYHITIHFNPCSKDIWVDTTLVKVLNIQNFTLKGTGDWATGHPLTIGEENDKALVTISLTEGATYEFKLQDDYGKWYGNGQTFTRDNSAIRNVVEVEGGANMTLNVDKTGEYLFTYFFDSEELLIQYPAIVPAEKIAPIGGKFTINAHGDTAVFSRGNLQYNYESDAWYVAEKQYDVLGDLNLRFGDNTYAGSIDLFGWSCESSDFGKQWKYKDADFTGAFVDWGTKFADDEKEWSTLSKDEWTFLLARKKDNHKLWTMLAIGPDSLNGLALFPNDWEAPAGLTIKYGFYDLDNETDYKANSFTFAEWEQMEAAGAVFLPLSGTRAGYYGNTWSGTAESSLSNILASGYDWVDNVNWMGYYWTSTPNSTNPNQVASLILPGWHNNTWQAPTFWDRERRRGQPVRLVTRIPKNDYTTIRSGLEANRYYTLCYPKAMTAIQGGTLWSFVGKDANMAYIIQEDAPFVAGRPYLIYAESDKLEAIVEGDDADAENYNGLYGTLIYMDADALEAAGATYMLKNNELRPIGTNNHLDAQRAYVILDEINGGAPNNAPAHKVRKMPLQQEVATGMDELHTSETPVKMMIDGKLYILRGEQMFDATGRLVK